MRPLHHTEIVKAIKVLSDYKGARLQEVRMSELKGGLAFGLGFFHQGELSWLIFDMTPAAPVVVLSSEWPSSLKKTQKPLSLFVNSHFVGHRLVGISVDPVFERVMVLDFPMDKKIEIRLITHAENILVTSEQKSISLNKPKELKQTASKENTHEPRDFLSWSQEWLMEQISGYSNKGLLSDQREKIISKKLKGLAAMKSASEENPEEVRKRAQKLLSELKSEEAELFFNKAKQLESKKAGRARRIEQLEKEIKDLESGGGLVIPAHDKKGVAKDLNQKTESSAKKIPIDKGIVLYIGRNAQENLKILRKSSPRDIWMHLRDYPGAHGIVHFDHAGLIEKANIKQICQVFLAHSHKTKHHLEEGDPVDVVLTECRYVKPIRGDKLGRVSFSNDKTVRVIYNAKPPNF